MIGSGNKVLSNDHLLFLGATSKASTYMHDNAVDYLASACGIMEIILDVLLAFSRGRRARPGSRMGHFGCQTFSVSTHCALSQICNQRHEHTMTSGLLISASGFSLSLPDLRADLVEKQVIR